MDRRLNQPHPNQCEPFPLCPSFLLRVVREACYEHFPIFPSVSFFISPLFSLPPHSTSFCPPLVSFVLLCASTALRWVCSLFPTTFLMPILQKLAIVMENFYIYNCQSSSFPTPIPSPSPSTRTLESALPIELLHSQKCTIFSIWLKTIFVADATYL